MAGMDSSVVPEATGVEAASSSDARRDNRHMPSEDCITGINSALQHPTVRFLREQMEKAGCPVLPWMIRAMNCMSTNHNGSYNSGLGITCCDHMRSQDQIISY
uniref:Mitochondrial inner membrane protease ATP23 n=1 Tax=Oryza punctata TaxID=4537 RepID=A0A0E0MLG7_ORYPU